jgi:hypothetical protein
MNKREPFSEHMLLLERPGAWKASGLKEILTVSVHRSNKVHPSSNKRSVQ